jgi:hypothetical protein
MSMARALSSRGGPVALMLLAGVLGCSSLAHAQMARPQAEDSEAKAANDADFQQRANTTLLNARKLIDGFFDTAANAVCKENVSQMMIGKNNKPYYREDAVYEYQLLASNRNGSLRLKENREVKKASFRDPYKSLLITIGFTNMLLVLHENYEASYAFEPVLEEQLDGQTLVKFQFRPIAGGASPAVIQLSGRNYPLQLRGNLWIDEASGAVVKLTSSLDGGLDDLGLHDLRSEVHYAYLQFHDPEEAYWLPASAVIDVETPRQHWRNVHRFSEYRRFRSTVRVEMGDEKQ